MDGHVDVKFAWTDSGAAQWKSDTLSLGVQRPGRAIDHSLHLLLRLIMSGSIPPLHHTPCWRVQSQLYLFKYALFVNETFYFKCSANDTR